MHASIGSASRSVTCVVVEPGLACPCHQLSLVSRFTSEIRPTAVLAPSVQAVRLVAPCRLSAAECHFGGPHPFALSQTTLEPKERGHSHIPVCTLANTCGHVPAVFPFHICLCMYFVCTYICLP